jgi:ABC-type Fe3+ transport system permease subunit
MPAPSPPRLPALSLAGLALAAMVCLPLLAVLLAAAVPAGAVWAHIAATTLPEMLGNSAMLAALVAAMAGSAGALTAWLVTACRFPGHRLLEVALLLPLAMPAYVSAYAYTWLLDAAGPVQSAIRAATAHSAPRHCPLLLLSSASSAILQCQHLQLLLQHPNRIALMIDIAQHIRQTRRGAEKRSGGRGCRRRSRRCC